MPAPQPRYETEKAIEELTRELDLSFDNYMQDWPYEVASANDIDKYIEYYRGTTDEDVKFALMMLIIQATEDQKSEADFLYYWNAISVLLKEDFTIHACTVYYWSCFDAEGMEEAWTITPHMRQLWNNNQHHVR
jgi:hypothetical protein